MASIRTDRLLPSALRPLDTSNMACSSSSIPASSSKSPYSLNKFYSMMKYERLRLITYLLYGHQWPKSDVISPSELAKAGFFYLHDDAVQCTFCRGIVRGWDPGDIAMDEHKRHFPKCPFIVGEYCGNMPIEIDPDINSDTSNFTSIETFASTDSANVEKQVNNNYNKEDIPRFPQFSDPSIRSRTFLRPNWKAKEIDTNKLIEAGFFYTDKDDRTRCFHCGGMLFKWKPEEIPLEEHARFFPECQFMISTRGQSYIEYVQFKTQIIELRQKLDSPQAVKCKDIDCMKKITYESFLNMKQSAYRTMNKLEKNNNKADLNTFYQRYLNKFFFLIDCQKLFHFLQYLNIMQPSSPPPDANLNLSSSSSSNSSANQSIFSLEENVEYDSRSSSDDETEVKQKKGEDGKPNLTCILCCDKQIEIVFVPCGHQLACRKCSVKCKSCPICRVAIEQKVRTFFAH